MELHYRISNMEQNIYNFKFKFLFNINKLFWKKIEKSNLFLYSNNYDFVPLPFLGLIKHRYLIVTVPLPHRY